MKKLNPTVDKDTLRVKNLLFLPYLRSLTFRGDRTSGMMNLLSEFYGRLNSRDFEVRKPSGMEAEHRRIHPLPGGARMPPIFFTKTTSF